MFGNQGKKMANMIGNQVENFVEEALAKRFWPEILAEFTHCFEPISLWCCIQKKNDNFAPNISSQWVTYHT